MDKNFQLESIEEYEAALAIVRAIEERVPRCERSDEQNIVLANLSELLEAYECKYFPVMMEDEE